MRHFLLRSGGCLFLFLFTALTLSSIAKAQVPIALTDQGDLHAQDPDPYVVRSPKEWSKRRLSDVEEDGTLASRATMSNGKKSLWRSASAAARKLKKKIKREADGKTTMVRRDQVTDFCSRFSSRCTSQCSAVGGRRRNYLCGQSSSSSTSVGINVRCQCGTTDYTGNVLVNQAPTPALKVAITARTTTTRTVVSTSTIRTTGTSTRTVCLTSTLRGTTYSADTTTTLPTTTSVLTLFETRPASTSVRTLTRTTPSTVRTTRTSIRPGYSSTTTEVVTATSTTVQLLPAAGNGPALATNGKTTSTTRSTTTKRTSSTKKATSTSRKTTTNKTSRATAQARDLLNMDVDLLPLAKRQSSFCSAYTAACSNACSSRRGSRSVRCAVANANSYTLSCMCNDGTSQSRRALNVAQSAATTTTTTSTVTSTVTSVRLVTITSRRSTSTTTTTTMDGPIDTQVYLQFILPYTDTTTTETVGPLTTYRSTSTVTVPSLRTVATVATIGPISVTTTTRTTTELVVSTSRSTSTSTTTSPPTTTNSPSEAQGGRILVRDANTAEELGLLSASQDEDSFSFLLDPSFDDGMTVTVIPSTVSSSTSGLVGLQMDDTAYGAFNYVGFETQDLSDTGVQPNSLEYLLLTDTAPNSGSVYPSVRNGDTGAFPAIAFAWTLTSSTNRLMPIWTNPLGSSPVSTAMQMYMLCSSSGGGGESHDDCFIGAAFNQTTWTNFDTAGITITRVHLILD